MPLIDAIVSVTVTKTSSAVSRQGFGTPLGVFQVATSIQSTRFQTYASVAEMTDAGFGVSHPAVLWATVVFSQDVTPDRVAIGRRVVGTAQVDTVTITTPDAGTWTLTINGTVYSFVAGASDTTQSIAVGLANAINSDVPAPQPVVASTPVAGVFTVTAFIAGEAFTNGGISEPGAGVGTFVNTTANVAAEAMSTTLTAIEAENELDWYFLNIETRNDADITTAAAFIAARDKIGVFQSSDPDGPTGVGGIFATLQATNNRRVKLFWHDDDAEFKDAGMTGIAAAADLDAVGGAITWQGKQIVGVPASVLTSSQIDNILGLGGSVAVTVGGRSFVRDGKSVEGEFMDVQTTIDWTKFRVQEAVFARIATTPTKVPYTSFGIATIVNEVLGVLTTGVGIGHFSGDFPPTVTAPAIGEISDDDKNNRILRNVVGTAKLAGAIHETIIQVNVSA